MSENLFDAAGVELPEEPKKETAKKNGKKTKKNNGCCAAGVSAAGSAKTKAANKTIKEPEKDLPRLVYLVNEAEQRGPYEQDKTLEDIRKDIERDYPAYTKNNTKWTVEKQKDEEGKHYRYLCIATYSCSKAG
jgi:hypothetical protein